VVIADGPTLRSTLQSTAPRRAKVVLTGHVTSVPSSSRDQPPTDNTTVVEVCTDSEFEHVRREFGSL